MKFNSQSLSWWLVVIVATLSSQMSFTEAAPRSNPIGESFLVRQGRRLMNVGSTFGSARTHAETPYDRILGHPVFQVTTSWGSSYMTNERLSDKGAEHTSDKSTTTKNKKRSARSNEYRTISLYFMDPDDALAHHADLQQIDQMKSSDIRITSMSLGKAVRQAANLNNGLLSGAPLETRTGTVAPTEDGGSLRYKILPPKRQLYYAARCIGKERVGLFGANPEEDAQLAVLGNAAIEGNNLARKQARKTPGSSVSKKVGAAQTDLQVENAHMEGNVGIPVFYAQGLKRRHPKLKHIIRGGSQNEIPLFFSYEDLQDAWTTMKRRNPSIPDKPEVEVFNMWDVLTSMDKDEWKQKGRSATSMKPLDRVTGMIEKGISNNLVRPFKARFGKADPVGLQDITFVPPSNSVSFKEELTRRGNGKARLRPMR